MSGPSINPADLEHYADQLEDLTGVRPDTVALPDGTEIPLPEEPHHAVARQRTDEEQAALTPRFATGGVVTSGPAAGDTIPALLTGCTFGVEATFKIHDSITPDIDLSRPWAIPGPPPSGTAQPLLKGWSDAGAVTDEAYAPALGIGEAS
jgi:hypothetical protein